MLQRKQLLKPFMHSNTWHTEVVYVLASLIIYTTFGIFKRHQVTRSVAAAFQQTWNQRVSLISLRDMTEIFEGSDVYFC